MSLIHIEDLSKHFKILNRREGLSGAFRDLFSGDYRTVEAVSGISFDIDAGEIVGYIAPKKFRRSSTSPPSSASDSSQLLIGSGQRESTHIQARELNQWM